MPAGIGESEIEQLQRATERSFESLRVIAVRRIDRPADLTSDIAELLRQRERRPSTAGKAGMQAHCFTSRSTIAVTFARIAGSSTERVRFAWLGRMLIMESNSMKSGVPNCPG